jgi:hypothetical protein
MIKQETRPPTPVDFVVEIVTSHAAACPFRDSAAVLEAAESAQADDPAAIVAIVMAHAGACPFSRIQRYWWHHARTTPASGIRCSTNQLCSALAAAVRSGRLTQAGLGDGATYTAPRARVVVFTATTEDVQREQVTGTPATWRRQD